MPAITIRSFGGIAPAVPPRYLQDSQAQIAINCPVFRGSIQPLTDVGASLLTLPKTGTPQTIYRFGQDTVSDMQYWFHWTTDVDVCRSQIAGDTSEWTFFTGDGAPKATYAALALTGSDYPAAARRLGLPAPTSALIATENGTPDTTDTTETRVYTYTWVSKEAGFEVESAPAPAALDVEITSNQTVTLSGFAAVPTGDYNVTHKRIYRSVNGVYLYVDEITAATTSYEDSVAADALGEEIPSLYWSQSPDDLAGLINLPNGMMAGFVGRDVYFSEPYRPHAWPETYMQTVDYPVVGLGRMDTTLAVLTTGVPYLMQGAHPDSVAVVKSDLEQACVSKRSIVSFGSAVIYAAPDGLMMLSPGGSSIVTQNLFNYTQWQEYFAPESIHAYAHDNQYIGFYDNGTVSGGFIFDVISKQFILHDIYATAGYRDLQRDKLFLAFDDRSLKTWFDGSAKSYTWKSKKFTMPQIMGFSCAQLEAEAYPMTLKVIADGAVIHTQTVQNRNPFRLPAKVGRDWELQVEGSSEVFSLALATSMTELAGG
jgi:hypothetical protein